MGVLIGVTGGIGSGKSTVARRLTELGATEIDADLLAREVVEPGSEGLTQVAKRFGEDLIQSDGTLNRALLAQRAFASDQDRKDLEGILHPLIQRLSIERIAAVDGIAIYTIPLLVETNSSLPFDKIITISCPDEVRIQRLITSRGMSEQEARSRIAAQATDAERELVADFVIYSDCTMEELIDQVDKVYKEATK